MRLNARATRAISSPPISGARAVRSPVHRRSVARSNASSLRRAAAKISAAAIVVPTISTIVPGSDSMRVRSRITGLPGAIGGRITMLRSSPLT